MQEDENDSARGESDDSSDLSNFRDSDIGSDPEDMDTGEFFKRIKRETMRASKERKFLVSKLKTKSRVGSIFFDEPKRVVAAIQKTSGKYDYLVEWNYNKEDKLKPNSSIVKGSHFVFVKPLLYRRYME